jgi:formiminoglutamase
VLSADTWKGRVDDTENVDSFRWHQCVELIDLNTVKKQDLNTNGKGFCFLGFSCDKGVEKNKGRVGTALGPFSIRRAMANLPNIFESKGKIYDAGNIHCLDGHLESAQKNLGYAVERILDLGFFPIILGGGHEIAFGHYQGLNLFSDKTSEINNPGIINFDAHFDMRPYDQGPNSGTMFRQIADMNNEKNKDFSYFVLGIQKTSNTISLFKKADELGVDYILAREIKEQNFEKIARRLDKFIEKHDSIYLTVCSDGFSSAFAPGVSSPQPFGMNPEVVLQLIKYIIKSGKTISMDIAEVSPRFDEDNQTAKLASVIVYAVINTILYPEES